MVKLVTKESDTGAGGSVDTNDNNKVGINDADSNNYQDLHWKSRINRNQRARPADQKTRNNKRSSANQPVRVVARPDTNGLFTRSRLRRSRYRKNGPSKDIQDPNIHNTSANQPVRVVARPDTNGLVETNKYGQLKRPMLQRCLPQPDFQRRLRRLWGPISILLGLSILYYGITPSPVKQTLLVMRINHTDQMCGVSDARITTLLWIGQRPWGQYWSHVPNQDASMGLQHLFLQKRAGKTRLHPRPRGTRNHQLQRTS